MSAYHVTPVRSYKILSPRRRGLLSVSVWGRWLRARAAECCRLILLGVIFRENGGKLSHRLAICRENSHGDHQMALIQPFCHTRFKFNLCNN